MSMKSWWLRGTVALVAAAGAAAAAKAWTVLTRPSVD